MGKAEGRQDCLRLGLRGKFAGWLSGLLEQFRNGVAAPLEKDAKFSRSRSSLLLSGRRGEAQIKGSSNTLSLIRSEEHTSELQSLAYLVCRLLLEKKKKEHATFCRSMLYSSL